MRLTGREIPEQSEHESNNSASFLSTAIDAGSPVIFTSV